MDITRRKFLERLGVAVGGLTVLPRTLGDDQVFELDQVHDVVEESTSNPGPEFNALPTAIHATAMF